MHNMTCRKHSFCEFQLTLCINDIARSLDLGDQVDIVVLDFQKAFDKVSHTKLLQKLTKYGISGQLHQWVSSFLLKISQTVVLGGTRSTEIALASGVPQGSVLGLLLFAVFINDLPLSVSSHVRLFADDYIVYKAITKAEDALTLQEDLNQLDTWAYQWSMSFHHEKCELIRVTNNRQPIKAQHILNKHNPKGVDAKKYLGISINSINNKLK